jgi:predicted GIY-YIG superfamily endonuclease
MSAWFYILRLKSGRLYPGATADIETRWRDHQCGEACRTTRIDPPVDLVHRERFETFAEARCREAQVKRWSARKKEALVAGDLALLRRLAVSHDQRHVGEWDRGSSA